jgi:hypothetical protein
VRLLPSAIDQQTLGSRLAGPAGGGGSLAAKLRNLRCPPLADSQAVRFRMSPSVSAFRLQANFRFRPLCGRLSVGKDDLEQSAELVGAAMCPASRCGA